MAVLIKCPHPACAFVSSVDETQLGATFPCPHCQRPLRLPPAAKPQAAGSSPELKWLCAQETVLPGAEVSTPRADRGQPLPAAPPAQVGRYEITTVLGAGAFGTVYRARDPQLDREVALKVLHAEAAPDPHRLERFQREAKAAARLRHPHIVPVFEAVCDSTPPYIASALIEGGSLAAVLMHGPMDPRRAAEIVRALASALAHAHGQGVVHRDVKPANILLDEQGLPYLTDFGVAHSQSKAARMTRLGAVMGTAAYMAPEQAAGRSEAVEPASDQYSLGVVLYELLCGQRPFDGPPGAILAQVRKFQPPAPSEVKPGVPPALEAICGKAMARQPEQRYASCQGLAEALQAWLNLPTNTAGREKGQPLPTERLVATPLKAQRARPRVRPSSGPKSRSPSGGVTAALLLAVVIVIGVLVTLMSWSVSRPTSPQEKTTEATLAWKDPNATQTSEPKPDPGVKSTKAESGKVSVPLSPKEKTTTPTRSTETKLPLNAKRGDTRTNKLGMKFAWVPPGTNWIGGGGGTMGTKAFTLNQGLWCGVYEVTQGEWQAVTGNNPSYFKGNPRYPVEQVSWNDVQGFIQKLKQQCSGDGLVYRLPTEEEWEYICRGGPITQDESKYHFYFARTKADLSPNPSNDLSSTQANFNGQFPAGLAAKGTYLERTCAVGSYVPNPLGIYDLHGNVWEWTSSVYEGGSNRVVRGGSWGDFGVYCTAPYRNWSGPGNAGSDLGFRLLAVPSGQ